MFWYACAPIVVLCADQLEFVLTKLRAEVDSLDKDGWVMSIIGKGLHCSCAKHRVIFISSA